MRRSTLASGDISRKAGLSFFGLVLYRTVFTAEPFGMLVGFFREYRDDWFVLGYGSVKAPVLLVSFASTSICNVGRLCGMQLMDYSVSRGLKAGAVGGIAGSIVVGVFAGVAVDPRW